MSLWKHPVSRGEAKHEILRQVMEAISGHTPAEVAELLGVNRSAISSWSNGHKVPSAETLARIPFAFKVNGHWLLTGKGQRELPQEQPDIDRARREGFEAGLAEAERRVKGRREPTVGETIGAAAAKGRRLLLKPDAKKPKKKTGTQGE